MKENVFAIFECGSVSGKEFRRQLKNVKQRIRERFLYKRSRTECQGVEEIENKNLSGWVQGNFEKPEF